MEATVERAIAKASLPAQWARTERTPESAQRKLARAARDIEAEEAIEAGALGFLCRDLAQATLPHRDLGQFFFNRRNGAFRLSIYSHPNVGLPYGRYPRLLLIWMCTEAVRTRNPVLDLGPTLSGFMQRLGLIPSGGNWGTIHRLRDQMKRLFSATVCCTYEPSDGRLWHDVGFRVAEDTRLWWNRRDPEQLTARGSTVELNPRFFAAVIERPIPIDLRAIRALRSVMALDIYVWLTHRNSYLKRPTEIPWGSLQRQFGTGFSRTPAFKAAFLRHAKKVLTLYPHARLEQAPGGLVLKPAPTHVGSLVT